MKHFYTVSILFLLIYLSAGAQVTTERCFHLDKVQFRDQRQDFWRSHELYSTASMPMSMLSGGYYNLTEGNYAWGLGVISTPQSHHFAGVTTVNGWRLGNGIAAGLGVGYMQYDEEWFVPVYADVRYYLGRQRVKFFLMGAGGLVANFDDFKNTSRYFVNPGAGLIVPLARHMHLSFTTGLYTQYDVNFWGREEGIRDSFVNMKLGLLFGK